MLAAISFGARWSALMPRLRRYGRPVRDALILAGLARAFVYYVIQGIHPWEFAGIDARAYYNVDLAHPYVHSGVGEYSTYLYSPAFAQLLAPLSLLPFNVFFALWTAVSIALLVWLIRPWPWIGLILFLPISYELFVGNIHYLMAAAFVVVLRAPSVWSFPLLTKITPGVGIVWHAVRGEWRALSIATATVLGIVTVSFALSPSAWIDWIGFLLGSGGRTELLIPRCILAAALVLVGARTSNPWVIPVAGWLALPVIWVNSWVILLGLIRLSRAPWRLPDGAGDQVARKTELPPRTGPSVV